MKVLMFGWEFPPFISGGLGTASLGITNGLLNSGADVTFVLPTKRGKKIESRAHIIAADEINLIKKYSSVIKEVKRAGTTFFEKEFNIAPYFTSETYHEFFKFYERLSKKGIQKYEEFGVMKFTGNYGKNLMDEVHRYGFIGEVLGQAEDFDIIHAHDWLTYYAGVAAKNISKKPLVIHVHATEFDRSGENINQELYDIERFGMDHADKIVAVSYYTKNILVKRYGQPESKIEVVHNAVSKQTRIEKHKIKKNFDEKIVLFLGRITMQKGPDYFIEAAKLVYDKIKNVRFVMAGSGDMLPRMINRMAEYRMIDRFHFTGFLTGIDVERMYAISDIYVMPSVSEPFGISPFEAIVHGVPAIISKQSGVAELLNHAPKVDFWDVKKLSNTMIDLLQHEELAKEIADQSSEELNHIHWDKAGAKLNNLYQTILNQ